MQPRNCYKFPKCSASVCPLDKDSGSYTHGDRVCLGMTELVKVGGLDRVRKHFGTDVADGLEAALPTFEEVPALHRRLRVSAAKGSTLGRSFNGS